MPCPLSGDAEVPTARYGSSHVGRMKTVYREGLRNRYGALMQAISGVHFNYSFPSKFWDVYVELRELPRQYPGISAPPAISTCCAISAAMGWMVLYLFGVSPAVGRDFLGDVAVGLEVLDAKTAYGPYATSLRMSDIGYRNRNQARRQRVGEQPRRIPARPEARGHHAASGLRAAGREARRRPGCS